MVSLTWLLALSYAGLLLLSAYTDSGQSSALLFEITSVSSAPVDLILSLDSMSVIFISLVSLIAACVMLYTQKYMESDPNKNRLSGLLALFIASMILFIMIPNIITMLLGWDGLGIISFALVLFYNNSPSAGAAMITALTNRIGDILIIMALGLHLKVGHWNLSTLESLSSQWVYFLLLVASCTKSAQFPFCAWLPQAMAAPTPVSALVHSSTLVTAGVFLMIRLSEGSLPSQTWLNLLMFLATTTSLVAGLSALVETDLKKIVALSTLSQLGTMVLALSLGHPNLAFFHLVTHAVSKSLLFICVGTFISCNKGGQDTRNLTSQLWLTAPLSFFGATVANLSLCGAPFLSGYYSKDLILETLWQLPTTSYVTLGAAISTALTSAYSLKLLKISFTSLPTNESDPVRLTTGEPTHTKAPILLLSFMTLYLGYFLSKSSTLFFTPLLLSSPHKHLASLMLIAGWVLMVAEEVGLIASITYPSHHFIHSMFFLETLTPQANLMGSKAPLYSPYKAMDQGWIESSTIRAAKMLSESLFDQNTNLAKYPILSYVALSALALVVFLALILPGNPPFF
uniref:NADH dehydrogenase subunit 5 n=1 Tax=Nipponacmea fuscoviridis TaxID=225302 RepID=UPI001D032702|nr:NADH dehydrogenase subunit 5 [Nipponacmea fuscoviridis]QVH34249.1 NADH dehydrogenase subunit 5 [Nipponacmea fuscoviridis]